MTDKQISEILLIKRNESKLSKEQFAQKTGIDIEIISVLEQGIALENKREVIAKICKSMDWDQIEFIKDRTVTYKGVKYSNQMEALKAEEIDLKQEYKRNYQ